MAVRRRSRRQGKDEVIAAIREDTAELGADERATGDAISAALPVLIGALSRNASQPDGARALSQLHPAQVLRIPPLET